MKEYVIWGIPPNKDINDPLAEELLVDKTQVDGEWVEIVDELTAKLIARKCTRLGAQKVRIQTLDGTLPSFGKELLNL